MFISAICRLLYLLFFCYFSNFGNAETIFYTVVLGGMLIKNVNDFLIILWEKSRMNFFWKNCRKLVKEILENRRKKRRFNLLKLRKFSLMLAVNNGTIVPVSCRPLLKKWNIYILTFRNFVLFFSFERI